MNKKIFILLFFVIALAGFSGQTLAAEDFYIQLHIKETGTGSDVNFALQDISALYGDYDKLVSVYEEGVAEPDYILETYDSAKEKVADYSLDSARFLYYDTEEGGGAEESNSGVIKTVIRYGDFISVEYIRVNNQGIKTGFIPVSKVKVLQAMEAAPVCAGENESVDIINSACCSGFIPASQSGGSYVCVKCGDNVCSQFENEYSCKEDCQPKPAAGFNFFNVYVLYAVLAVLTFIFFLIEILKLLKRIKNKKIERDFNLVQAENNAKKDDLGNFKL